MNQLTMIMREAKFQVSNSPGCREVSAEMQAVLNKATWSKVARYFPDALAECGYVDPRYRPCPIDCLSFPEMCRIAIDVWANEVCADLLGEGETIEVRGFESF